MKKFHKFISLQTDERRYWVVILSGSIEILVLALAIFLTVFLTEPTSALRDILFFILFIPTMYVPFKFFAKLINVSDNRKKDKFINKRIYKEKYAPYAVSLEDFKLWLNNAKYIEELIIKSEYGYKMVEMHVENGIRYPYINNKYYGDVDKLIDLLALEQFIVDDKVFICETIDCNSPELFQKTIDELKSDNL